MHRVPRGRIQALNDESAVGGAKYVLYWMIANRRTSWNFSLDRALEWAKDLEKPLVVLEALRCDYPWASDRLHGFVVDGMMDNARRFEKSPVLYYPYLEPSVGKGKGLLKALARHAAVIVTDDYPAFFLPRAVEAAARQVGARLESVDSNGLLPMRSAERVYPTAYAFRRFLQKNLPSHLADTPRANPLARLDLPAIRSLPEEIRRRWPSSTRLLGKKRGDVLLSLPLDHAVEPAPTRGGASAARRALSRFLRERISRYAEERNEPEKEVTSGLSPYLHFGHISAHEVFAAFKKHEEWSPARLEQAATGSRSGWWGMSASAEAFLDQLVTWRELGFNMAWQRRDSEDYDSLPEWARKTLAGHARDRRPYRYSLEQFEAAGTHDPLWNAAQMQLVREGRIHNYLRMLWGKKILEWSTSPREALAVMIELNNRFALDGRDPNSTSGIFWILGRYDRPWGPERPVFGTVRYMSSRSTARKIRVQDYIRRYTPDRQG